MSRRLSSSRHATLAVLTAFAVAGLALSDVQPGAAEPAPRPQPPAAAGSGFETPSVVERPGMYDARVRTLDAPAGSSQGGSREPGSTFEKFAHDLGSEAIVDFDRSTGTPRNLGRLDGFLTGKSAASPKTVALQYVRAHHAALGLSKPDLATFRLTRNWTDVAGIRHLSFTQHARGIALFGNGLRANVTDDGRLISLQGSPVSGLAQLAANASATPTLSAAAARIAAAKDVGGSAVPARARGRSKSAEWAWPNHDFARLVWLRAGGGLRLGWSTYVQAGGDNLDYQHVIDAKTGATLYRHDTVASDKGDARVYENYPGARFGGTQHVVNLFEAGYLPRGADSLLDGRSVSAWSDYNDDNRPAKNELVRVPGTAAGSQFAFRSFAGVDPLCRPVRVCSWDPNTSSSWRTNRRADVLQGFYFDSKYHDYLMRKPIGFTPRAGNFESRDGDPVLLNALDGANTDHGLPDAGHIDNANMSTPPDGIPPTMQMYLFHVPGATDDQEPFLPSSSSFDPFVILHEYTHGLSNRLVVDVSGNSTLNSFQAWAMGEAWSDYYAEDYLVKKGLRKDTEKPGQLFLGDYLEPLHTRLTRTEPMDCPVASDSPRCAPLNPALPAGGYTYADLPAVLGFPEAHASGEIWGQTLWDLRTSLGHPVTASIVTRAMSLSPDDPSFLDMRNAILQADLAVYAGSHRTAIWRVFAHRGMGFNAATVDGADLFPAEDFSMPPKRTPARAQVRGQVTDRATGNPVAGALVAIGGHDSGFAGDYAAVTDAGGRYAIDNVVVGSYPRLSVVAPGYEIASTGIDVAARDVATSDFSIRRDWAAAARGATLEVLNGPTIVDTGCGAASVNDLSQGTAWVTLTGHTGSPADEIVPKSVLITLPRTVRLTGLAVDPTMQCGLGGSASVRDLAIESSPNGTDWTVAATAVFDGGSRYHYNDVPVVPPIDDVRYLRVTLNGPQVPTPFADYCPADPTYSGCTYMGLTELEAFGAPM